MAKKQRYSDDTKLIIVALLLMFFYPLGVILMWTWTSWPKWAKWILTIPVVFAILSVGAALLLIKIDPAKQIQKAQQTNCQQQCQNVKNPMCIADCMNSYSR